MMDQILSCLTRSSSILIATHANPDGDAIGSLIALGLGLESVGKKTSLYVESPIPAVYRFLPSVERITKEIDVDGAFETAVVVDCGNLDRVGSASVQIRKIPVMINIDHHITNTGFGHVQYIDPSACATAELVYRLLKKMRIGIDKAIATCLYTGILTDTGSFRFSNTNEAAFEICKEMAERGVLPHEIARRVYGTYSLGRIKLLNLALDSIEISCNGKLSMMTVTQEMLLQTGTQPEDADGLIHYARRIQDVRVAALIQEIHNGDKGVSPNKQFHVSLRSDGTVDVAAIAASFGGGGHQSAAGFGIQAPLAVVKSEIANLADEL